MKKRILRKRTVTKRNRTGRLAACLVSCVFMTSIMTGAAEYQYDAMGRLEAVTYENGDTVRYSYDANGNIRVCESKSAEGTGEGSAGSGNDTSGEGGDSSGSGNNNTSGGDGSSGSGSDTPGAGGGSSGNQSDNQSGNGNSENGSDGAEGNGNDSLTGKEAKKGDIYSTKNARYQIVSTGKSRTVTLKSFTDGKAKKFTIPAAVKIDGKKYNVIKIASKAFQNKTKLSQVTIGKNITQIGSKAFYKCKNLKKVTVKTKKLKSVGKNAFKGIFQKAVIKVPRAQFSKYAKLFKNKGQAKSVKITK